MGFDQARLGIRGNTQRPSKRRWTRTLDLRTNNPAPMWWEQTLVSFRNCHFYFSSSFYFCRFFRVVSLNIAFLLSRVFKHEEYIKRLA